jgi:hypothetical protein
MACRNCGLQWTMTMHRLAQAAPKWNWSPLLGDDAAVEGPKYLAKLAAIRPETRGRAKGAAVDPARRS